MAFDGVLRAFSRKGPLHFYAENAKLWFAVLPLACRNNAGMFDFPVPLRPVSGDWLGASACFRGLSGHFPVCLLFVSAEEGAVFQKLKHGLGRGGPIMCFSRWPRGWLKHEKSHTEQEVRFKNLKHTDNGRRQGGGHGQKCCGNGVGHSGGRLRRNGSTPAETGRPATATGGRTVATESWLVGIQKLKHGLGCGGPIMCFSRWPRGWLKHEKSHTERKVCFKNLKHTDNGRRQGGGHGQKCCGNGVGHGGGRRNGSTSVAGARLHTDNDRRQGGAE